MFEMLEWGGEIAEKLKEVNTPLVSLHRLNRRDPKSVSLSGGVILERLWKRLATKVGARKRSKQDLFPVIPNL